MPVIVVTVQRAQETRECPIRDSLALTARNFVRETEVDALVHSAIDYVRGRVRKAL